MYATSDPVNFLERVGNFPLDVSAINSTINTNFLSNSQSSIIKSKLKNTIINQVFNWSLVYSKIVHIFLTKSCLYIGYIVHVVDCLNFSIRLKYPFWVISFLVIFFFLLDLLMSKERLLFRNKELLNLQYILFFVHLFFHYTEII